MFTLVEFQMINKMKSNFCRLEYLPNLAAAQIIACLKQENIKSALVKGQTRYLKDIFISERKELFELLSCLQHEDISASEKEGFRNLQLMHNLFLKNEELLKELLDKAYNTFTGHSEKEYLEKDSLVELLKIKNGIFELYDYCYKFLKKTDLSIISNLVQEIKKSKPDMAGFSLTSNYDFAHFEYASDYVIEAINRIKKELEIPVIVTGQMMPTLDNLEQHIFNTLNIDYFLFDEGYMQLASLLKRIEEGKSFGGIQNIACKSNSKIKRDFRKYSLDFNILPPPDFSDFDLDLYFFPKRILPLQVSTTCNWQKCVFCEDIAPKLKYGSMNEQKFLDIIRTYRERYKTNFVEIQSISPSPNQMISYMKTLISNNIDDVFFAILSRLEKIYCDRNISKMMHKGGLRYVLWGLESGYQKTLDRMNKGTKIGDIEKVLGNFSDAKIKNMCYVIVGFPGETRAEFERTVSFLQKNHKNIDGVIMIPFSLFKNSYIAKHNDDFFIKRVCPNDDNPTTYKYEVTKGLTHEESKAVIRKLRDKIDAGKIRISKKNLDPLDQSYIEKIGGFDALHHVLFYLACREANKKVT